MTKPLGWFQGDGHGGFWSEFRSKHRSTTRAILKRLRARSIRRNKNKEEER